MDNLKNDVYVYEAIAMPLVIDPLSTIETKALLTGIAFSRNGERLAWGEREEAFHIADHDGGNPTQMELEGVPGPIAALSQNKFVMGMSDSDMHLVSSEGEVIWSHKVSGGCDVLSVSPSGGLIAVIDGSRSLHMLDIHGRSLHTYSSSELNLVAVDRTGRTVAVADDAGVVKVFDRTGETRFERHPRSSAGERVTAIAFQPDGHLVIAKETLGLAGNDENELEAEWWSPLGQREHTAELSARCTGIAPHSRGCWLSQFDGRILKATVNSEPEQIWQSSYAIQGLETIGDDLLVASWFHLYRIPDQNMENEPTWQIEHAGIVEHLAVNGEGDRIAIGGEDQNDYTDSEPILIIDANAEPREMEINVQDDPWTADLDMGGVEKKEETDIYADDFSAISDLLTEDERAQLKTGGVESSESSLLSMLSGDIELEEMAGDDFSADILLSGLEGETKAANIPPVSNAGDDQKISTDDEDAAVVLLDGSESFDPDGTVVSWTWKDRTGNTIGDSAKLKVKLSKGTHHFELTVKDNDGATTTDTTTVVVE